MTFSGRAIFASFYPPCKLLHENFVAHFQSLMHEMEIFLGYYFEM